MVAFRVSFVICTKRLNIVSFLFNLYVVSFISFYSLLLFWFNFPYPPQARSTTNKHIVSLIHNLAHVFSDVWIPGICYRGAPHRIPRASIIVGELEDFKVAI